MLNDDEQLANFLLLNGMLSHSRLHALQREATEAQQTLYLTVMVSGEVEEQQLVGMLSQMLDLPSVLLSDYVGDPDVLAHVPSELARRRGVLPVGVADIDGRSHLYVAMANPLDAETLGLLRDGVQLPVVPLLAGPGDLLRAIARNIGGAEYELDTSRYGAPDAIDDFDVIEEVEVLDDPPVRYDRGLEIPSRPSMPAVPLDELHDLFGDLMEPSGVQSALSMIDDMPRERHVAVTPPSGLSAASAFGAPGEPFRSTPPSEHSQLGGPPLRPTRPSPALSDAHERTGLGVATRNLSGSFRRAETSSNVAAIGAPQGPPVRSSFPPEERASRSGFSRSVAAVDGTEWRKAPAPVLARALAQLLIDRGIIQEAELVDEVRRQKTPR